MIHFQKSINHNLIIMAQAPEFLMLSNHGTSSFISTGRVISSVQLRQLLTIKLYGWLRLRRLRTSH